MKVMLRLAAAGAAGVGMIALLALVLPGAGGVAALQDLYTVVLAEPARGEDLNARLDAVVRCRDAKAEAAKQVAAGRMSLTEAAGIFERLDEEMDGPPADPAAARAWARRSVIHWVASELQQSPRERATVVARLERERARLDAGAVSAVN